MSSSYYQKNNPKRQKLVSESIYEAVSGEPAIDSLDELKKSLQNAIFVEHFTIPPYLCALYSIKAGTNDEAYRLIQTVVVEEMLHMVMVANLLNAIGGKPLIKGKAVIAKYPNPLPHSAGLFKVSLLKFSKEAINTFLRIERPAVEDAPPEPGEFHTIGQFYEAIRDALKRFEAVAKSKGETIFIGKPKKQVTSEHYYGSGGKLFEVHSLDDAENVLDEIIGQGEGIAGGINVTMNEDEELAHYFRFNSIFHEKYYKQGDKAMNPPSGAPLSVDWNDVYNMEPNPTMKKFKNYPWLLEKVVAFNKTYLKLLDSIHYACNGKQQVLKEEGIPLMYQLKLQAEELMKIPSGNGNYTAGPTFEYVAK